MKIYIKFLLSTRRLGLVVLCASTLGYALEISTRVFCVLPELHEIEDITGEKAGVFGKMKKVLFQQPFWGVFLMPAVPPEIMFIHHFLAGFFMSWMGLLLTNIKPKISKLFVLGLVYAIFGVLVRYSFNVAVEISFLLQVLLLVVMVMWVSQLGLRRALVATVLGTIILSLGELVSTQIIVQGLGVNLQKITNPMIIMIIPLPQIVLAAIIIYLSLRFKLHLFDFQTSKTGFLETAMGSRKYTTMGLVLILLLVILVQLLFSVMVINQEFQFFKGLPLSTMGSLSTSIIILGVITMAFLIVRLVELTEKEGQYHLQAVYIDTLDELYTAIRSERHDIINHLQTIYGFNKLGYIEEVQYYLDELLGGNILSSEFVITGTPGLTALLYIKSGIARTNDIQFEVSADQAIDRLPVSPYEINNILGNLINNAFDAVLSLHSSERIVTLHIGADDKNYIFKVSNPGHIEEQVIQKLMKKGFSTKQGEHAGLGLHICQQIINKYGGRMEVTNADNVVEFSVYLPMSPAKEDVCESDRPKAGAFAG
jgi:Signal transduction histidine kinase regulating citrate/malate metabolism